MKKLFLALAFFGAFGLQKAAAQPPCSITNVVAEVSSCNDGHFFVHIDFEATGGGAGGFKIQGSGYDHGTFPYSTPHPIVLGPLPANCTTAWEFVVLDVLHPDCHGFDEIGPVCCDSVPPCAIFDLTAAPIECNLDGTYFLKINFQVQNPTAQNFKVWAGNGMLLGTFPLSALPLTIPNFPPSGNPNDVVKVCINDAPNCCKTKEFVALNCNQPAPCAIFDATAMPLECHLDGTQSVKINFHVQNPGNSLFEIWAGNGTFLGTFPLASLPLVVPNFPPSGAAHDQIKICINDHPNCCQIVEFAALECGAACKIWNVDATPTPCLFGYFFILIEFEHENGGASGVKIVGNGQNHGTFPYSAAQPIVLGPFLADGSDLEFAVVDIDNPDCHDGYHLGPVNCATAAEEPTFLKPKLTARPTAGDGFFDLLMEKGIFEKGGALQIFNLSGQAVFAKKGAAEAVFEIDATAWPSGFYICSWRSEKGIMTARFFKN